jgi:hypothetical protein
MAAFGKPCGGHVAVATVVACTAYDRDAASRPDALRDLTGRRRAGALHQPAGGKRPLRIGFGGAQLGHRVQRQSHQSDIREGR